jgi:hypothetical protein
MKDCPEFQKIPLNRIDLAVPKPQNTSELYYRQPKEPVYLSTPKNINVEANNFKFFTKTNITPALMTQLKQPVPKVNVVPSSNYPEQPLSTYGQQYGRLPSQVSNYIHLAQVNNILPTGRPFIPTGSISTISEIPFSQYSKILLNDPDELEIPEEPEELEEPEAPEAPPEPPGIGRQKSPRTLALEETIKPMGKTKRQIINEIKRTLADLEQTNPNKYLDILSKNPKVGYSSNTLNQQNSLEQLLALFNNVMNKVMEQEEQRFGEEVVEVQGVSGMEAVSGMEEVSGMEALD